MQQLHLALCYLVITPRQVQQLHLALAVRESVVVGAACLCLVPRSKRDPTMWGAEVWLFALAGTPNLALTPTLALTPNS